MSARLLQFAFLLLLISVGASSAFAQAPDLYGQFVTGHEVVELIDQNRGDRPLLTDIWYPVDAGDANGEPPLQYYQHYNSGADFWWYPSPFRGGVQGAEVSDDGPFPVIVLSHGFGGFTGSFHLLGESLASHGYIVAAPRHTGNAWGTPDTAASQYDADRPKDVVFTLDQIITRGNDTSSILFGSVDESAIGLGGYSYGADTVRGVLSGVGPGDVSAEIDTRAKAALYIDRGIPTQFDVPLLHVGGGDAASASFGPTSSPRTYGLDVANAHHWSFGSNACQFRDEIIDSGAPAQVLSALGPDSNWFGCGPGLIPPEEAQELLAKQAVAFFDLHVKEDEAAGDILTPTLLELNTPSPRRFPLQFRFETESQGGLDATSFVVTDPQGRQAGFDPEMGGEISDFGAGNTMLFIRPDFLQLLLAPGVVAAGDYLIAAEAPESLSVPHQFRISLRIEASRNGHSVSLRELVAEGQLAGSETFATVVTIVPEPATTSLLVALLVLFAMYRQRCDCAHRLRYRSLVVLVLYATLLASVVSDAPAQDFLQPIYDVNATQDLTYGTGAIGNPNSGEVDLKLDLYEPTAPPALRPAVIFIHGGGFEAGNKSAFADLATAYASSGYVSASIMYRLADDPPTREAGPFDPNGRVTNAVNAAINDATKAVRWVRTNADAVSIDPSRIAVGGFSAGAITSLFVGYEERGADAEVGAVISFAGSMYGNEAFIDADDPPLFTVHGTADPLVPFSDAEEAVAHANAAGLPVDFNIIQGGGHDRFLSTVVDGETIQQRSFNFLYEQLGLAALDGARLQNEIELIGAAQQWNLFAGIAEPSGAADAAWAAVDFDDSGWDTAPEGFGFSFRPGIEDRGVHTVLDDMSGNFSSVYLRKKFEVSDAEAISGLILELDYNDAYVAFVNGVEVARSNVENDGLEVPFDMLATRGRAAAGSLQRYIDLNAFPDLLSNGPENVLAIQGINVRLADRDFVLSQISLRGVLVPEPATWTLSLVVASLLFLRQSVMNHRSRG